MREVISHRFIIRTEHYVALLKESILPQCERPMRYICHC